MAFLLGRPKALSPKVTAITAPRPVAATNHRLSNVTDLKEESELTLDHMLPPAEDSIETAEEQRKAREQHRKAKEQQKMLKEVWHWFIQKLQGSHASRSHSAHGCCVPHNERAVLLM